MRDLFVDYLNERRPALDYNTFEDLSRSLVARFWADLEHHHPGIDSLHLSPEIAAAWKERIRIKTVRRPTPDGQLVESTAPRLNPSSLMATVRAFYLDLATWTADEPGRWARWVAPCPIKESDVVYRKHHKRVRARADQRTRERMPTLPVVLRTAELRLRQAQERLAVFRDAPPGERFSCSSRHGNQPRHAHLSPDCGPQQLHNATRSMIAGRSDMHFLDVRRQLTDLVSRTDPPRVRAGRRRIGSTPP